MTTTESIRLEHLGQTGMRLDTNDLTVLVDPYLSHSVQELDAPALVRQVPIPYQPGDLTTVDWVLITHDHIDHCDPHTLPIIAKVSPNARFIGPFSVRQRLEAWGIESKRILPSSLDELALGNSLRVRAIPAAHPKIRYDTNNQPQTVGYFFQGPNHNLYLAGDTSVCEELIIALKDLAPIDSALLPVNEDNYFRRRQGIIGNMSIREAFGLAAEVGIKYVSPVHWDMFEANGTYPREIKAVYSGYDWPFKLVEPGAIQL